jgi:hypothetical protein
MPISIMNDQIRDSINNDKRTEKILTLYSSMCVKTVHKHPPVDIFVEKVRCAENAIYISYLGTLNVPHICRQMKNF